MFPLSEVADIVMGQSPPGTSYNELGEGLPFFQGKAEFGEDSPTPVKWCSAPSRIAESGDILMSVRAPVGPTNVASEKCCIGRGLAAIRARTTTVEADYLLFFFKYLEPVLATKGQGSTFAAINKKELHSLPVPVPSLDEQRRIVDILRRADGIRRLRKQAQDTAHQLIPALFVDIFGDLATNPRDWPVTTVGEVIESADYGSSTKASEDGAGLPLIRMGNVDYSGRLDLTDLKYVQLPDGQVAKYRLTEGDILFNRTNSKELVGKTGLWAGSTEAVAASYFIRVQVNRTVLNPYYLWAFMNSGYMKRVLFETARGAIGQSNINAKELRAFQLPLPPVDLQERFEDRCREVLALEVQGEVATTQSQKMFNSILHRAFNGEL